MVLQNYEYVIVSPGTGAYQEYLSLRHEVFCEELKRVTPNRRRTDGRAIESDDYDVHSLHVLCRSLETGAAVGCSRLILPGPNGLNVSARYKLAHHPEVAPARVGEIGRLALSSSLRRHRSEASVAGRSAWPADETREAARGAVKRDGPTVALGLYREIFGLASCYGITHCYAAMEPALARLLNRLGFPFHEAGPLNAEVSPARQPYVIGAQAARAGLASRNSCLYRFMFGRHEPEAAPLASSAAWPVSGGASYRAGVVRLAY